jgi:hypothetical protein
MAGEPFVTPRPHGIAFFFPFSLAFGSHNTAGLGGRFSEKEAGDLVGEHAP